MWFGCITLFPGMFDALTQEGIVSRAIENKIINLAFFNPRDFAQDKHKTVDDRPYGGGPGMVMMPAPLAQSIEHAKKVSPVSNPKVIYLSPKGSRLNQDKVKALSNADGLICISGRYEGIDQRIIEHYVDEEISIGDYVLSGGELPSMVLIDAIARMRPGVLGCEASKDLESFSDDGILDCPHYTRPFDFNGLKVPQVLLGGDHQKIEAWRKAQAMLDTKAKRKDLLNANNEGDSLLMQKEFENTN